MNAAGQKSQDRLASWSALIAAGLAALAAPGAAQAQEAVPAFLTCPDAATIELRPGEDRPQDRDPARIREIAPSAGAVFSPELYSHARYADLAYDLYAAFDAGKDPAAAFSHKSLTAIAFIYGEPGRDTERGLRQGRTRTLYGFVADDLGAGRRYIVFRGTQEPAEWVRNVQAGQRAYPSGDRAPLGGRRDGADAQVHAGFLQIFDSLELEDASGAAPFAGALPDLVAGRDAVFVGHSLGSALATLAGVEAARRAPESAARLRVVTLASPRVGDKGFAALAAKLGRIDRVCNLVDPVAALPPSTRQIDYVHVGAPFRVSSFDWPNLANDLERAGDQVLCWHGHQSYAAMLNPYHKDREPPQCFTSGK